LGVRGKEKKRQRKKKPELWGWAKGSDPSTELKKSVREGHGENSFTKRRTIEKPPRGIKGNGHGTHLGGGFIGKGVGPGHYLVERTTGVGKRQEEKQTEANSGWGLGGNKKKDQK